MRVTSVLKQRGRLLGIIVVAAFVLAVPVGAAGSLDQSQEVSTSGFSFSHFLAQTFTPGTSGNLDQVDVYTWPTKGSAWPKQMTVSIRSTLGGVPTATILASETVTNVAGWDPVALDPPASVSSGVPYAIVVECLGADPVANDICAWRYTSGNPYAGGAAMESSNAVSWSTSYYTNVDFAFRTYMSPPQQDQTISFATLPAKTYGTPDFDVSATASSGLAVSFAASGDCTLTGVTVHLTDVGSCTVTASQAGNESWNAAPDVVRTFAIWWPYTGFLGPIDNPPVYNVLKAGAAAPVKFSLLGDRGLGVLAAGYPVSAPVSCWLGLVSDTVEETVTAGSSSLGYDPLLDQYTYIWKTNKTWAGSCRMLTVRLADGTDHIAYFSFK